MTTLLTMYKVLSHLNINEIAIVKDNKELIRCKFKELPEKLNPEYFNANVITTNPYTDHYKVEIE